LPALPLERPDERLELPWLSLRGLLLNGLSAAVVSGGHSASWAALITAPRFSAPQHVARLSSLRLRHCAALTNSARFEAAYDVFADRSAVPATTTENARVAFAAPRPAPFRRLSHLDIISTHILIGQPRPGRIRQRTQLVTARRLQWMGI
jgi:hypothetical protein